MIWMKIKMCQNYTLLMVCKETAGIVVSLDNFFLL